MSPFMKDKKEDREHYKMVSLTSVPGNLMEQILWEIVSKHIEDKKLYRE